MKTVHSASVYPKWRLGRQARYVLFALIYVTRLKNAVFSALFEP